LPSAGNSKLAVFSSRGGQLPSSRSQTIRPHWAGELFDLHACVQALFTIRLPEQLEQDQQAAYEVLAPAARMQAWSVTG
jgi:hypothetical protein